MSGQYNFLKSVNPLSFVVLSILFLAFSTGWKNQSFFLDYGFIERAADSRLVNSLRLEARPQFHISEAAGN